jgi:CBS domain-containing protein
MSTVKQLLEEKNSRCWSITSQQTVLDALRFMAEKDIGALLVIDNEKLAGVFTERDYARKVILKSKSSKNTPVGELMTREVFYVSPADTIENCMALMTDKHVRHLPVMDAGRVTGIVSIGDVVKHIITEQQLTIQQLKKYIAGDL